MTRQELLQCHALLKVLSLEYDVKTTESPTLRWIQLCDLFGVNYLSTDKTLNIITRYKQLPRILIKTVPYQANPQSIHHLNFCQQVDHLLLSINNEQYNYIYQRLTNA